MRGESYINGNVYNNPGCDTLEFEFDINLCDMIDFSIEAVDKQDSCCTYKVNLDLSMLEGCEAYNPGTKIIDSLLNSNFKLVESGDTTAISSLSGYAKNGNNISFNVSKCSDSLETETMQIISDLACDYEFSLTECKNCSCPSDLLDQWLTINVEEGGCEGGCKVTGTLNIPEVYNCYTHYRITTDESSVIVQFPIPPNGELQFPSGGCIDKGAFTKFTLYLRKDGSFNPDTSCYIEKSFYCPVNSDVKSCVPDCDSVEFKQDTISFDLQGCPNCKIKVKYSTRTNTCINTQDIQILSMEEVSDSTNPYACGSCSIPTSEIYRQSVLKVIYQNDMGFLPIETYDPCDTTWRLVQSSCWAEFINIWGSYATMDSMHYAKFYLPCDSVECCMAGMRVCRTPVGITVTPLNFSISDSSCVGDTVFYSMLDLDLQVRTHYSLCEYTCDWMFGIGGTYSGKSVFRFDEKEDYYQSSNFEIKLLNYGDALNLKINSKIESNNFKFQLQSLVGSVIEEGDIKMGIELREYQIQLNDLSTGVYFLNIFNEGKHILNKKIIIVR